MKDFSELTKQELLALAIALEEEDSRGYSDLAEANGHGHRLLLSPISA
jgi:rubrerythrin